MDVGGDMTVSIPDTLQLLSARIIAAPGNFASIGGTFLFTISNSSTAEPLRWCVNCFNPITFSHDCVDADCEIECDERDFMGMVEGTLNPQALRASGRLKLHGSARLGCLVHRILQP